MRHAVLVLCLTIAAGRDGVEAARSAAYRLRYDRSPRARLAPFVGMDAEYDAIRKIDLRVSGGAGVNLNFDYAEAHRTTLALGLIEEYERPATGSATTDTRFHTRFALLRTVRPGVVFELNAKYQPSTAELCERRGAQPRPAPKAASRSALE